MIKFKTHCYVRTVQCTADPLGLHGRRPRSSLHPLLQCTADPLGLQSPTSLVAPRRGGYGFICICVWGRGLVCGSGIYQTSFTLSRGRRDGPPQGFPHWHSRVHRGGRRVVELVGSFNGCARGERHIIPDTFASAFGGHQSCIPQTATPLDTHARIPETRKRTQPAVT